MAEKEPNKLIIPADYRWAKMVSPFYGTWVLGFITDDVINDIRAYVERIETGEWHWHIFDSPYSGIQPNRDLAMKVVMSYFERSDEP